MSNTNKHRANACVLRNKEICQRYLNGEDSVILGKAYNITRTRIGQILAHHGINQHMGGRVKRGEKRRQANYDRVNNNCLNRYGINIEEKRRLSKNYSLGTRSPTTIYARFCTEKKRCGYFVKLTFTQWWQVWQDSGHWFDYGRYKGQYFMALSCKTCGTYRLSTVHIIPFTRWKK